MINFPIANPSSKTYMRSLCMYAKLRNRIRPSYTLPTFSFPFFLPFLLFFFSVSQFTGNGLPPPPLGWLARNTPGGFVTGGWARFCGLAEPALTFYGYVTTPRGQNRNPIPVNSPWNRTLRWRHRPRNGISL